MSERDDVFFDVWPEGLFVCPLYRSSEADCFSLQHEGAGVYRVVAQCHEDYTLCPYFHDSLMSFNWMIGEEHVEH